LDAKGYGRVNAPPMSAKVIAAVAAKHEANPCKMHIVVPPKVVKCPICEEQLDIHFMEEE
jgi:hypothetical protein